MKTQKVLLIGGPGTGKSSVMAKLEQIGFVCFHEISREVTLQARKEGIDQLFLEQPLLFSKKLLAGRINQHKEAENAAEKIVFLDRGIPDISAYLDFTNTPYPTTFIEANKNYSYDIVFIFPLWEEIYTKDQERYESLAEAKLIQQQLITTYKNLGYILVEVPKASVEKRVEFILNFLNMN
ncbi:AAA family ATPase [Mesonia aquimarina]|uniref:AAA family ATPase n=1 Tax=Mesonia aquimarina TaxID=1504967 RepID=UPI000EF5F698|nr:ATP-binding protein [Mesonia aquimarina]